MHPRTPRWRGEPERSDEEDRPQERSEEAFIGRCILLTYGSSSESLRLRQAFAFFSFSRAVSSSSSTLAAPLMPQRTHTGSRPCREAAHPPMSGKPPGIPETAHAGIPSCMPSPSCACCSWRRAGGSMLDLLRRPAHAAHTAHVRHHLLHEGRRWTGYFTACSGVPEPFAMRFTARVRG